jgi:hypothetical protein
MRMLNNGLSGLALALSAFLFLRISLFKAFLDFALNALPTFAQPSFPLAIIRLVDRD